MTTLNFDIFARDHASKDLDKLSQGLKKSARAVDDFGTHAADSFDKAAKGFAGLSAESSGLGQLQKAIGSAGDASASAAHKIQDADTAVARSQRAAEDAQANLAKARQKAAGDMRDLQTAVRSAGLAEESAVLSLARAKQKLDEAGKFGDALEMRGAELGVQRATLAVEKAKQSYAELSAASEHAAREGVNGSDDVVAAQRRLADAQRGVREAQRRASEDASRGFRKNVQDVNDFADRAAGAFLKTASSLSNIPTAAAGLAGVGQIVSNLAGLLGLLPGAAATAGAAFATLAVGTHGFVDGLKGLADSSKIQKGASGVADAAVQAARRIETANQGLARAQRGTKDAEEALTRAQQNSLDAQLQLTRAREDAAAKLDDLKRSLSGAALDEEAAVLGVQRAQQQLADAGKNGGSALDMREAELGVRQAEQALIDTRARYADLRKEAEQANKAGVAGSDAVVSAQRGVADAAIGVTHAQQGLVDAAENVRDAQREVAQAHEDAARSATKAGAALAGSTAAFDKLSKNAQDTVRSILSLSGAWTDLQHSVSDALFAGFAGQVKDLGGTYIPVLKQGMTGVAAEFNKGGNSLADFLRQGAQVGSVTTIFAGTKGVVANLTDTLKPLVSILLDVAAVGSEMLPGLTGGFGKAAEGAAAFVRNARETGQLRDWIQGGLDTLHKLGELFGNIGSIVATVFAGLDSGGKNFLDTMISVTGKIEAFLKSFEGQAALKALGQALSAVSSVVTEVLLTALKELAPIIVELAPGFAELAKQVGSVLVVALKILGPILQGVAGFLSDNMDWIGPLAIALYGLAKAIQVVTIATRLLSLAAAVNPWVLIIAATILLVTLIITYWDEIVGAIKAAIDWVINFVKDNWQLLISIILGPLGIIIALVVTYWDDIMAAFSAAWNWISSTAVTVWEGIKNAIVDPIVSAAEWVGRTIGGIIDFFVDMPKKIGDALGSLGSFIGEAFKWGLNKAIEFLNWGIDKINDLIYGVNVLNPFDNIPYIPHVGKLHSGGVVPGAPGSESLWILQAGETVLPADWGKDQSGMANYAASINNPPPSLGYRDPAPTATAQSIEVLLTVHGDGGLYEAVNNGLRSRQIQLSLAGA